MIREGAARVPSDAETVPVSVRRGESIAERLQKFDPGARSEAAPVENVPLGPGDILGHYRILGRLGSGGMGDIHRALDLQLEREVALKVALEPVASDHDAMLREARALAALNHPNVVTVHEVGVHEGCAYIVMELLRGETLRSRMDRERPSLVEACSWACDVLRGLSAAHSAYIVHLDIKPENVFLTKDGPLKLIDFGVARRKRTGAEEPDGIAGTIAYMAPEQLLGDPIDFRADIFSFGVLLHELVTGRHPFLGPNVGATMHALLQGDFFQDGAAFDPEVEAIVRACMELEPSARPPSCAHVLEDLQRVLRARTHEHPAQATLVANRTVASERTDEPRTQAEFAQQTTDIAPAPRAPAAKNNRLLPILGIGLVAAAAAFADTVGTKEEASSQAAPPAPATQAARSQYTLELESSPVGATVRERDKELGKTPMTIELDGLATAPRVFTLSLAGYVDYTFRQEPAFRDIRFVATLAQVQAAPESAPPPTSKPASSGAKQAPKKSPRSPLPTKTTASAAPEPSPSVSTLLFRRTR